jgi:hypothetical protein
MKFSNIKNDDEIEKIEKFLEINFNDKNMPNLNRTK